MLFEATREIYWNIDYGYIIYFLIIPVLAAIAYGIYKRYRLWRLGQPENRCMSPVQCIWTFIKTTLWVNGTLKFSPSWSIVSSTFPHVRSTPLYPDGTLTVAVVTTVIPAMAIINKTINVPVNFFTLSGTSGASNLLPPKSKSLILFQNYRKDEGS